MPSDGSLTRRAAARLGVAPNAVERFGVISALGITQIMAWGGSYYLIGVLAKPIADDTGWPLAWVIAGLSVGLLAAGLVSRQVGRLIQHHGGRPVLVGSALLLAAGLVGLAAARSLPAYFAAWVVLGGGMGAGLYDAAFASLGRLDGAGARRAITTLTLWGGFASTVSWPLSAFLVEAVGWRGACLVYAAVQVFVSAPLLLAAIPKHATVASDRAAGSAAQHRPSAAELVLFAHVAAILVVGSIIMSVVAVHLITLLQAGRGFDLAAAVALAALIGPSQVGARIVEMAFGCRHHPIWTLTASVALVAVGLTLLALGAPVIPLALIAYGGGNGLTSIARGSLPLALFGPDRYAIWMGRLAAPTLIAGAAAPFAGALLMERLGPGGTLTVLAVLGGVNVVMTAILVAGLAPRGST